MGILDGKKGLIIGIANNRSIAWACAKAMDAAGATLGATWHTEKSRPHVEPLLDGIIDIMIGALRDEALPGIEQVPLFTVQLAIFGPAGLRAAANSRLASASTRCASKLPETINAALSGR